jgi:hypothetical protein
MRRLLHQRPLQDQPGTQPAEFRQVLAGLAQSLREQLLDLLL